MWWFPKSKGLLLNHPFYFRILHEANHPVIGVSPIYGNPHMENEHSGGSPFLPRLLHAEDLLGRVEWHADLEGRADFGMGIPLIRNHWAFYKYGDIIVDTAKIDV